MSKVTDTKYALEIDSENGTYRCGADYESAEAAIRYRDQNFIPRQDGRRTLSAMRIIKIETVETVVAELLPAKRRDHEKRIEKHGKK